MFIKALTAAGLVAASLALMPATASAKTNVHVNIGLGLGGGYGWCDYRPYAAGCRYGNFYRYRPERVYLLPRIVYRSRISCGRAKDIVWNSGFRKVVTRSCGGAVDVFTGWKRGKRFLISVGTRNGGIDVQRW